MKFTELNLSKSIMEGLKKLSYEDTTEIQEKCIPLIMQNFDVIGKSQTGSGKTFAYGIPAIEKVDILEDAVQVLIVCPTRELVVQVHEELKKLTEKNGPYKIVPIFGGSNMDRQKNALKNGANIVVGTPGRLMDHLRRKTLKLHDLKMVILDEADEMLNMGFKEDIETILKTTNKTHQTVMFSATMPRPILALTKEFMTDPKFIELTGINETSKDVKQYFVDGNKKALILKLLEEYNPAISIVFCNTKRMVDEATDYLVDSGYKAIAIHGDMRQNNRKKSMDSLKKGDSSILVATDVAARGIDIKDIDIVFNYDIPNDTEYYIHRIGRTGRAGKTGKSITFINSSKQRNQLVDIMNQTNQNIEELFIEGVIAPKNLVDEIRKQPRERREFSKRPSNNKFKNDDSRSNNRSSNSRSNSGFRSERSTSNRFSESDNRRSFSKTPRTFEKSSEEKPFENRKPSFERSENSDRKPSFGRSSDGDRRTSYASRKPSFERSSSREEKPAYARSSSRDNNPRFERTSNRDEKPSYASRKPSYERSENTYRKSSFGRSADGDRKASYASRKPSFGRSSSRDSKPTYAKSDRDSKPSFSKDRKSFDKKPSGDRKSSFGGARSQSSKPSFGGAKFSSAKKKPSFGRSSTSDRKPSFKK